MKSIGIQIKDSPKMFFLLKDIYGDVLTLEQSAFYKLSFSVVKIQSGSEYPVEGYTDVTTGLVWNSSAQEYPENIKGLTAAEKAEGYNLVVFPYRVEDGAWVSPFTEANATYNLIVTVEYNMQDDALASTSKYHREYRVRITTGNN